MAICSRTAALACGLACLSGVWHGRANATTATPTARHDTPTATATPVTGHLMVSVAEFPPCEGRFPGATVTLEPLGLVRTDPDLTFDVPPGRYTLAVANPCTQFGCWPNVVVDALAGPQDVLMCMVANPTPTPTVTATPTANPTGALGEKTFGGRVFNLVSGVAIVGADVECASPRVDLHVASDAHGDFSCTLDLRDADTILLAVAAPGFAERRRGYAGLDLWRNDLPLQVGLLSDGVCGGDCNGDHLVAISELVQIVAAILDDSVAACALTDVDGDGRVAVNDAVSAINSALDGCPSDE
jgi:hypothetical protein